MLPFSKLEYQWSDLPSCPKQPKNNRVCIYIYIIYIICISIYMIYKNTHSVFQDLRQQWLMFSDRWKRNKILSSLAILREFPGWNKKGENKTIVQGTTWIEETELRVQREKCDWRLQHRLLRKIFIKSDFWIYK